MSRYCLTIEYNGKSYKGWQKQENLPTVQGAIEAALARLGEVKHGEETWLYGAGRTDAGVHAIGQIAHVDLQKQWGTFRLQEALNGQLQDMRENIAILFCENVNENFHARFCAKKRHYLYRIIVRRAPLILEKNFAWNLKRPLDVKSMQTAANLLLGQHDFTTFRSSECQAKSPIKTLDSFTIKEINGVIEFKASALSFLHHQVRSMVGAVKMVGEGRWQQQDLSNALLARDRTKCPPLAPSCGLYLMKVDYQ